MKISMGSSSPMEGTYDGIFLAINIFTSSGLPLSHSALFVQPKYAHLLQGFVTNKVLGIPDDLPEKKGDGARDRQ